MEIINGGVGKGTSTPQEVQAASSEFVKRFAFIIQAINTPGLTGAGLLKMMQEYQKEQQKSDVAPK